MRVDGRLLEQLRPTRLTPDYLVHAEGSVLIEAGQTKVICTASVEPRVPPFLRNTGKGWATAEYGMLPRATNTRSQRESSRGKVGGRTQEIQRLIGRSMRAATNLDALGERTVQIDCDVIQADGGTRTPGALHALEKSIPVPECREPPASAASRVNGPRAGVAGVESRPVPQGPDRDRSQPPGPVRRRA